MRRRRRLFGALAAFVAVLAVVCAVGGLAYGEPYDYTVRVFPGNRGKLEPDPVSVKVEKGGRINLFDIATADTSGSKYIQIGFRLTGTDTLLGNGVVNGITEDMDYVVAYGVQGETVAYTLKFEEYGTGKELASPQTYYGRIGDKPVAAYEYIEGYRPLYLTITGTLKENPDENVWTFEYVALQEGETTETSTTTTSTTSTNTPGNETVNTETVTEPGDVTTTTRTETVPGTTTTQPGTTTDGGTTVGATTTVPGGTGTTTTTVVPVVTGGNGGGTTTTTTTTAAPSTAGGGDTTAPSAAGGNNAPSNVAADAGGAPAGETSGDTGGTVVEGPAPATREILDMDNPLAGPGSNTGTTGSGGNATQAGSRANPFAVAGIALAAAIALGLYFFFIWKRKKDEENEPEPEE